MIDDALRRTRCADTLGDQFDHLEVHLSAAGTGGDGGSITMHTLEQGLIRPRYDEPRIHYALICGAVSCPPLLDEPFVGSRLDEQLDELGRRWLSQPDGLRVDPDGDVYLSAIFKWYKGDFRDSGGFAAVIDRYLDDADPRKPVALAAARDGKLKFLPYDWSINLAQ